MEDQQRGAKAGCSGTINNLLVKLDCMVTKGCHRYKRSLSKAWIDVRKAFDSIDNSWLNKVMHLHRFPMWICDVVGRSSRTWNTCITVATRAGLETSQPIHFNYGLPQGDALCLRLFSLCLNPVAWKLSSSEGYRLSKPISSKVTTCCTLTISRCLPRVTLS